MRNQYTQYTQYPEAYSKDNARYSYYMDDGTLVRLTAGVDSVTEEWIARLKADHIEELNMLRRGRSKGEGKNKLLSLAVFEDEAFDKSDVFIDPAADVEANYIAGVERVERCEAIRSALASLAPEQIALLIRMHIRGDTIETIAKEERVSRQAIQNRHKKIEKKLRKIL